MFKSKLVIFISASKELGYNFDFRTVFKDQRYAFV